MIRKHPRPRSRWQTTVDPQNEADQSWTWRHGTPSPESLRSNRARRMTRGQFLAALRSSLVRRIAFEREMQSLGVRNPAWRETGT